MSEHTGLTNNQVADIYQSMLNGDKDSLYKLQQVGFMAHLPKVTDKYKPTKNKINTEQNIHHQLDQPNQDQPALKEDIDIKASSVANIARKKEQMYLNVIKRGAKMGALSKLEANPLDKFQKQKRWVNSSNQSPQKDSKEIKLHPNFNRQQNISHNVPEQYKTNHTADLHLPKKQKIYALPKVPNPRQITKVQSAQVAQQKKNVSLFQSDKPKRQKKKLQRIDFKQMISKSKKERSQFESKNQEERKVQADIMQYHRSTKDFLESIRQKFQLNFHNKRRFLKRHKSQEHYHSQDKNQTNNTQKMSPFKANMAQQRQRCIEITEDVNLLMIMYNKNSATINKLQRATNNLSFARYLEARGNSVSSISEEEEDEVQPLDAGAKNHYRNLMAHTRQKKWGLVQRTEYEAQRTQSLGQSRRRTGNSRLTHQTEDRFQNINQQENKLTINQRLKNLLFT